MKIITKFLKKANNICYCLVIVCLFFSSCSSYKIISTDLKVDFIQSPATKLKFKADGKTPKDQYQYILFYGLSDNYQSSNSYLNDAIVWSGNTNYFYDDQNRILKKLDENKIKASLALLSSIKKTSFTNIIKTSATNHYESAMLDTKNSVYFIQFDYSKLVTETAADQFNELAMNLYIEIAGKEGSGDGHFNWASGISQNIIAMIWESIPIPEKASLARYNYTENNDNSVILLDPKFKLKIDAVNQTTVKDGLKFQTFNELKGLTPFEFKRNSNGKIVQNMLGDFNVVNASNRFLKDGVFLIASAADIQYSSTLKDIPYIALYTVPLKRNNSYNQDQGQNEDNDKDPLYENSCFVHLWSTNVCEENFKRLNINNSAISKSVFGLRNSIFIFFEIYVNSSSPTLKQIKSTPNDLTQLPKKYKLFRKYNLEYKRVKGSKQDLILLPDDKLKY